jgi:hypothetical protein
MKAVRLPDYTNYLASRGYRSPKIVRTNKRPGDYELVGRKVIRIEDKGLIDG